MKYRKSNAADQEIARRLRARRLLCNLSQSAVADALGVSFQQVQKYEKGTNRVSAGRLAQLAALFKCGVTDLVADTVSKPRDSFETLTLLQSPATVRLARAVAGIRSHRVRIAAVRLIEAIAHTVKP